MKQIDTDITKLLLKVSVNVNNTKMYIHTFSQQHNEKNTKQS